uniref:NAD(+) kinase n=1 Tax=Opuntia streptacantha TaxID=393608 RepID=A0A7C9DHD6_OPUST
MDEPTLDTAVIMSEQVVIDGNLTALSLHSDGNLRWVDDGKDRCLNLEKEVIGVSLEDSRIVVKCAVESGGGVVCCKSRVKRTTFNFQPCSQDFREIWLQKIREYLDSLGMLRRLSHGLCCFLVLLYWVEVADDGDWITWSS